MFKETETYKKQANRYQYFCLFSNNIDLKNNRNDWKPFWIFCWANSCDKFVSIRSCQTMKLPYTVMKKAPPPRSGLRGGNGSNCPGPQLEGGPRDEICLFQTKYSFQKFRDSEAIQEYNSIFYSYVALSIKGPWQQLISPQVWLSARFSNRYWITYKYFRFCSIQIYLVSLVTFS